MISIMFGYIGKSIIFVIFPRALNDEILRNLYERLEYLRNLEEKKQQVLASIEEQGKLTSELKQQILVATTMVVVEDLYRPFRPKR